MGNIIVKTIDKWTDVYIVGESLYEGSEPIFCDTDDYSGATIRSSDGLKWNNIETIGCVYIYTREDLIANRPEILERLEDTGTFDDPSWGVVLYNFSGDITLAIKDDTGNQLLQELDPEKDFFWEYDELEGKRDDYEFWLEVADDTQLGDNISIQDMMSDLACADLAARKKANRGTLLQHPKQFVLYHSDIPEQFQQHPDILGTSPGVYIPWTTTTDNGEDPEFHEWICEVYPELSNTDFLIYMDCGGYA